MNFEKMRSYAPAVVRIGMSLVFLWFGTTQLMGPSSWTAFLPSWTTSLPVSGIMLVQMNGAFEVVFGILLLLGIYTRFVSALLALHILQIMFTVGYNQIGVRDFGLSLATISIFLSGADRFTVDARLSRGRESQ